MTEGLSINLNLQRILCQYFRSFVVTFRNSVSKSKTQLFEHC
jgi:hypothetical protein